MRTQTAASAEVMTWFSSMMRAWPHSALPLVGGDASTWEVVGPFHRGLQSAAGDLLLDSVEAMCFMAPASIVKEGGLARSMSSIDYFLIPKEAKQLVENVRVCWRLGRAVQMAPCRWHRAKRRLITCRCCWSCTTPSLPEVDKRHNEPLGISIVWRHRCRRVEEELSFSSTFSVRCRRPRKNREKRERLTNTGCPLFTRWRFGILLAVRVRSDRRQLLSEIRRCRH